VNTDFPLMRRFLL